MFDQSKYVCKMTLITKPEMPYLNCVSPTVAEAMRYAELRDKYDEDIVEFEKVHAKWDEEVKYLNNKMQIDILNDTGWANHPVDTQDRAYAFAEKWTDGSGQQIFNILTDLYEVV